MTAAADVQKKDYSGQSPLTESSGCRAREEKKFIRFSSSPLWEIQAGILSEGLRVDHPLENTCLANAYVDMILEYWRGLLAEGGIDPEEPLYVFEQGAGSGKFSWYMIRLLQERLQENFSGELTPVYLVCDPSLANLEYCRQHLRLKPYIEARCVDLVRWDGRTGGVLHLQNTFKAIDGNTIKNPVVFIANHHFGKLVQDLFYIDYGKLYQGEIALNSKGDPASFEACSPEYRWTGIKKPSWLPVHCLEFIEFYIRRLDSASVLIPTGALDAVQAMKDLSRGNMMLLSSDTGYHRERELRFKGEPDIEVCQSLFLPVNYDVINRFAEKLGAKHMTAQAGAEAPLFSTLVFNRDESGRKTPLTSAVQTCFDRNFKVSNPSDRLISNLVTAGQIDTLVSFQVLAFLRQNLYDPRVFECVLPWFSKVKPELLPEERLAWINALKKVWHNSCLEYETGGTLFETGLLAMDLGAWGTATDVFLTACRLYGDDPACLYNLSLCYFNTGDFNEAKRCAGRVLETDPEDRQAMTLASDIRTREKEWARLGWYDAARCRYCDINLVPLEPEHAGLFFYQYRDISIGILTRLPDFENQSDVGIWIENERKDPQKALFAVYHRHHGFSGMVSMTLLNNTGYFYFWTGIDYQGQGIGRNAASCLINAMKEINQIDTVYTSVYENNIKSQTALASLGFDRLTFQAEKPDGDVLFYRKGDKTEPVSAFDELEALLKDTESPIVLKAM